MSPHGRGGGNLIITIESLECERGGSPTTMVLQSLLMALATALRLLRPTPPGRLAGSLFSAKGKDGAGRWIATGAGQPQGRRSGSPGGPGRPPGSPRWADPPSPGGHVLFRSDWQNLAPPC